jgi:hypothetical protein
MPPTAQIPPRSFQFSAVVDSASDLSILRGAGLRAKLNMARNCSTRLRAFSVSTSRLSNERLTEGPDGSGSRLIGSCTQGEPTRGTITRHGSFHTFSAMRSPGLDRARNYRVRQLWAGLPTVLKDAQLAVMSFTDGALTKRRGWPRRENQSCRTRCKESVLGITKRSLNTIL